MVLLESSVDTVPPVIEKVFVPLVIVKFPDDVDKRPLLVRFTESTPERFNVLSSSKLMVPIDPVILNTEL